MNVRFCWRPRPGGVPPTRRPIPPPTAGRSPPVLVERPPPSHVRQRPSVEGPQPLAPGVNTVGHLSTAGVDRPGAADRQSTGFALCPRSTGPTDVLALRRARATRFAPPKDRRRRTRPTDPGTPPPSNPLEGVALCRVPWARPPHLRGTRPVAVSEQDNGRSSRDWAVRPVRGRTGPPNGGSGEAPPPPDGHATGAGGAANQCSSGTGPSLGRPPHGPLDVRKRDRQTWGRPVTPRALGPRVVVRARLVRTPQPRRQQRAHSFVFKGRPIIRDTAPDAAGQTAALPLSSGVRSAGQRTVPCWGVGNVMRRGGGERSL